MDIETLSSREVYRNPWITVREDVIKRPDGSTALYGVIDRADFVLVIPRDGDRFHLVEQFRYPVGVRCLEFPQGHAPCESPLEMAQRELREETGFTAATWHRLGRLHAAHGMCSQCYEVWLAEDLTPGPPELEHEEQDMRQFTIDKNELERMMAEGEFPDAHSLAAYALLSRWDARQVG